MSAASGAGFATALACACWQMPLFSAASRNCCEAFSCALGTMLSSCHIQTGIVLLHAHPDVRRINRDGRQMDAPDGFAVHVLGRGHILWRTGLTGLRPLPPCLRPRQAPDCASPNAPRSTRPARCRSCLPVPPAFPAARRLSS